MMVKCGIGVMHTALHVSGLCINYCQQSMEDVRHSDSKEELSELEMDYFKDDQDELEEVVEESMKTNVMWHPRIITMMIINILNCLTTILNKEEKLLNPIRDSVTD